MEEKWWPGVARYVGEERLRHQCRKLGVPSPPLLPIGGRVTVKSKRWHRAGFGPLTPAFSNYDLDGALAFHDTGLCAVRGWSSSACTSGSVNRPSSRKGGLGVASGT